MERKPLISIVIPAYQHGPELPKCLNTVFAQTIQDIEVIVVNDGSTDDTLDRLKPFTGRIRLINQDNRGGNAARNRGAAEAVGEFVMFCDADVIMRPDCLEVLVDALRRNPDKAFAYPDFAVGWKGFDVADYDAETLKRQNYIHTSALIRRDLFPGFDERVRKLQDWDLWLTMQERGAEGVHVPERLFGCIPHKGGISTWLPSSFYSFPWRKLGLRIKPLEQYWQAESEMRRKHGLPPYEKLPAAPISQPRLFRLAFLAFLLLELVSFVGYRIPELGIAAFFLALTLVTFLAWLRPDVGILLLVGELLSGSQGGYLLSLPIGGAAVSLRMGLFVAVFSTWFGRTIGGLARDGWAAPEMAWFGSLRRTRLLWPYVAFLFVVGASSVVGLMRGNGFASVFFDANGYFFLALMPAVVAAWRPDTLRRLYSVVGAGLAMAVIKSLFIQYVYSHRLYDVASIVYKWVRDTRVGEITLMSSDYYRIFFQSQVFALSAGLIAVVVILYARRWQWRQRYLWIFGCSSVAMVLSLSRSFWFGAAVAGMFLAAVLAWARVGWSVWRRFFMPLGIVAVLSVFLIGSVYVFPWPNRFGSGFGLTSVLGDRLSLSGDDAASVSRWVLLKELNAAIWNHPVIGSGLGTTVTYRTSDPRMVTMTGTGIYTTYAFEWGYHDMLIKFGALGLLAVLWFLWRVTAPVLAVVRRGRDHLRSPESGLATEQHQAVLALGIVISLVALFATNVFSPYLNHPLGIGLIMLVAAMVANGSLESKNG